MKITIWLPCWLIRGSCGASGYRCAACRRSAAYPGWLP